MKTVLLKQPGEIGIGAVEKTSRRENEVLLKVRSAGICGSDIGAYKGVNPLVSYPRIIGHEISSLEGLFDDLETFASKNNLNVIMSITGSKETIPPFLKEYLL